MAIVAGPFMFRASSCSNSYPFSDIQTSPGRINICSFSTNLLKPIVQNKPVLHHNARGESTGNRSLRALIRRSLINH